MASEWREVTVEQACSMIVDCPHSTPTWTESGVMVIRNTYLKNGRIDLSNPSYTDEEHYQDRIRRATPQSGDLVISREAPIGEIAMIPEGLRACLGQRVVLLRPNNAVCDGRFLLYSFIGGELRDEIMSHEGTGSTVSNLRIPSLKAAKVKIPPLPVQRRIAAILSAFDDKIELNRRMNRTLEALARALFKSWFVDFDPVRAKMRGEQPEGMDADTAALFPGELVEVDGREVPRGWDVTVMGKITSDRSSRVNSRESAVVLSAVASSELVKSDDYFNKRVYSKNIANYKIVENEDFAYNPSRVNIGSIGRLAENITGAVSPVYVVFRPEEGYSKWLDFELKREATKAHIIRLCSGSVRQSMSYDSFSTIPIVKPNLSCVRAFYDQIGQWERQSESNDLESLALSTLRDSLLPRLLAGEIDVSGWETASL